MTQKIINLYSSLWGVGGLLYRGLCPRPIKQKSIHVYDNNHKFHVVQKHIVHFNV